MEQQRRRSPNHVWNVSCCKLHGKRWACRPGRCCQLAILLGTAPIDASQSAICTNDDVGRCPSRAAAAFQVPRSKSRPSIWQYYTWRIVHSSATNAITRPCRGCGNDWWPWWLRIRTRKGRTKRWRRGRDVWQNGRVNSGVANFSGCMSNTMTTQQKLLWGLFQQVQTPFDVYSA